MKSRAMAIRTKFQVGDKVRIKDCSIARDGGYVGVQGSIAFYRNRLYGVLLDQREEQTIVACYAGELEEVKDGS